MVGQPQAEVGDQRGRFLLADGETFFGRAAADAGLDLVNPCDAAQPLGSDLGTILLIDVVQLAPRMCPAVGQCQRRATHAPRFGQRVIPGISIHLQDAVKAPQNVHRMGSTAPRCLAGECRHSPKRGRIGEDDCRGIRAIPAAIIPGQRPEIAGLGLAGSRLQHGRSGLVHEQPG